MPTVYIVDTIVPFVSNQYYQEISIVPVTFKEAQKFLKDKEVVVSFVRQQFHSILAPFIPSNAIINKKRHYPLQTRKEYIYVNIDLQTKEVVLSIMSIKYIHVQRIIKHEIPLVDEGWLSRAYVAQSQIDLFSQTNYTEEVV